VSRLARAIALLWMGVALVACEQPTVDPDQKLRDTIVGRAWTPDPAFPLGAPNPNMTFYGDGTVIIDHKDVRGTWSYLNSVFTITGPLGTYQTTSPAFDSSHISFYYGPDTTTPVMIHLIR